MMTTPSYTRLFPELAASVASTASSNSEVDEWIQRLVKKARTAELGTAVFGGVTGTRVLNVFQHGFELARAVFAPYAVRVPEPEEFSPAIEWKAFASALKDSASSRYELVIAPHGLGLGRWQTIGENHVLLSVSSDVRAEFDRVDRVDDTEAPRARTVSPFGRTLEWTARLLPASESPAATGQKWNAHRQATLPEMLVLQFGRVIAGRELVDPHSFTWLSGAIAYGRKAARHTFDRSSQTLRISSREIGQQGQHQGSRTPLTVDTMDSNSSR
ncbi:MAG: hypothetical protein ACTHZM_01630 [Canibacter sp.]